MEIKNYLRNLSEDEFRILIQAVKKFNETGFMSEDDEFRKFHEKFQGKDNFNFVISQVIIGDETIRRYLNK